LTELRDLLTRRLAIIGDAQLRLQHPEAQLEQLRDVSERITSWHEAHRSAIPGRLHHFLAQSSLQKALDWVETEIANQTVISSSESLPS
jgi:hypothetical protein